MAESGFIVCVPEAEAMVGSLRERFDSSARLGVPAHVTVLFPFMSPENITASVVQRIASVLREAQRFEFSLAKVARFPATAYLEPEPAATFIALTESLAREFPQFPPFGGEFPTIIPHLTVAHGSITEAEFAAAELASSLALNGPIASACSSLVLMENSSGTWRQMHVFPLARSHTAG